MVRARTAKLVATTATVACVAAEIPFAQTASALTFHTRGFRKSPDDLQGTRADIGFGAMANTQGCTIASTTITSSGRQLQAGVYNCNDSGIAGCPNGTNRFVERFNSGTYTCVLAGGASADTYYGMRGCQDPRFFNLSSVRLWKLHHCALRIQRSVRIYMGGAVQQRPLLR